MTTRAQIQLEYGKEMIRLKAELKQARADRNFNNRGFDEMIYKTRVEAARFLHELNKQRTEELAQLNTRAAEEFANAREEERESIRIRQAAAAAGIRTRYEIERHERKTERDKILNEIRRSKRNSELFYNEQIDDINKRKEEATARYIHQLEQYA